MTELGLTAERLHSMVNELMIDIKPRLDGAGVSTCLEIGTATQKLSSAASLLDADIVESSDPKGS